MNRNHILTAAAFAVLGVIAVLGWTRKSGTPTAEPYVSSVPASYPAAYPPADRGVIDRGAADRGTLDRDGVDRGMVYGDSAALRNDRYNDRYLSDRYVQSVHRPVRVMPREPVVASAPEEVQQREYVEGPAPRTTYVRPRSYERSTGKSAAIVAGTAAGGAAIGALAGGGKGAALGAVSGGAAGFVYDRLTHNHRR